MIFAIVEDADANLWLSSNQGISRVAKRELLDYRRGGVERIRSTVYGRADGMVSQECNGGDRPVWRDADGKLWFPTVKGLVAIDPRRSVVNRVRPSVVVERVLVDGTALPPGATFTIPAGARRIDIEYAGLSFIAPERMRFAVKLAGFDPDWVLVGARRVASFPRLRPGRYPFLVKAANSDGIWSAKDAEITLVQQPFFYQTWLFTSLVATMAVGLLWLTFGLRGRGHRRRESELKARIQEALSEVRVLKALLPICASCKKIRDDRGSWTALESYIGEHSGTKFSHGICPDCIRDLYPGFVPDGEPTAPRES